MSTLHRAKGFTTHDLRVDASPGAGSGSGSGSGPGHAPLVLHWRLLSERRRPDAPPGEEYPALYERAITLTAGARTIALGDHSGSPESSDLTRCRALGFRQPAGERWSFPDLTSVVSSFTVATMQGSSEWLVLDGGGDRLHVLGRDTHDGACPKRTMQGPLDVCVDMKWERRFDLLVGEADALRVAERVTIVEAGADTDFDCKLSYSGERLLPPQP